MLFRTYMFMSHLEGDLHVSVSRWTFTWTWTLLNQWNPTQILFGSPYSIRTFFSNSNSVSYTLFVCIIILYLETCSATSSFIIIIILFSLKLSTYYRLQPLIHIIMYFSIFPCTHVNWKENIFSFRPLCDIWFHLLCKANNVCKSAVQYYCLVNIWTINKRCQQVKLTLTPLKYLICWASVVYCGS